jgi:hypothetical protein
MTGGMNIQVPSRCEDFNSQGVMGKPGRKGRFSTMKLRKYHESVWRTNGWIF